MSRIPRTLAIVSVFGLCLLVQAHRTGVGQARTLAEPTVSFQLSGSSANGGSFNVTYSGFANDEALDFTFTAPDGTAAQVNGGSTFYASTEDDGSGAFTFNPAQYLSPAEGGTWTVKVTGETSGLTATTTFTCGSWDD